VMNVNTPKKSRDIPRETGEPLEKEKLSTELVDELESLDKELAGEKSPAKEKSSDELIDDLESLGDKMASEKLTETQVKKEAPKVVPKDALTDKIECQRCGAIVSKSTTECPDCGEIFKKEDNKKTVKETPKAVPKETMKDTVECPSCGTIVSNSAAECPDCGEILNKEKVEMMDCPSCNEKIPSDSVECPECGTEIKREDTPTESQAQTESMDKDEPSESDDKKPKAKPWLFILGALIFIGGVVGAITVYAIKNSGMHYIAGMHNPSGHYGSIFWTVIALLIVAIIVGFLMVIIAWVQSRKKINRKQTE